ncbi:MAG: ABC transporter ATP-binding protein [Bryobacteraceae bacterium]|nr:ABC transporter ATP-binding protein [Bryobacteraceae bacterium]
MAVETGGDILLRVQGVSKAYPVDEKPTARLRSLLPKLLQGEPKLFWALHDVSFELKRGESLGIVGPNGSGKSTLLQVAAGILRPTEGTVELNGRLAGLLELGSGFNPEFTGRQNVELSTSLHGLSTKETAARFDEIVTFADIGDFLDQPVKTYSTGMLMRLAFSVSIHVDADILLVDEALAVGDIAFRQRCMRRVHQMRDRGLSILFVSHSAEDVKAICDRCLWLESGDVKMFGETDAVVGEYLASMAVRDAASLTGEWESQPDRAPFVAPVLAPPLRFSGHRFGDRRAEVSGAAFLTPEGEAGTSSGETVLRAEDAAVVRFSFLVKQPIALPIGGFLVRDRQGLSLFSTNTTREGYLLPPLIAGDHLTVEFQWTMPRLASGTYGVTLAVSDGTLEKFVVCDYVEDALSFSVPPGNEPEFGWLGLDCEVTVRTA